MIKQIVLLLIVLSSCVKPTKVNSGINNKLNDLLRQRIEIFGTAVIAKFAMLITKEGTSMDAKN